MSSAAAAACSIIGVNNKPSQKVKENRALLFQLDSQTVKIDSLHEVARTTVKIYTIVFMLHEIRLSPPKHSILLPKFTPCRFNALHKGKHTARGLLKSVVTH